jgi:hypothetical protein
MPRFQKFFLAWGEVCIWVWCEGRPLRQRSRTLRREPRACRVRFKAVEPVALDARHPAFWRNPEGIARSPLHALVSRVTGGGPSRGEFEDRDQGPLRASLCFRRPVRLCGPGPGCWLRASVFCFLRLRMHDFLQAFRLLLLILIPRACSQPSMVPAGARTIRWIKKSIRALRWIKFSLRALWWIMPPGMFQGHALPRIWRQYHRIRSKSHSRAEFSWPV